MRETGGITFKVRIVTVHVIYIVYSTLLWLKLVEIGQQTGHPKGETEIALILWTVCFVVCHGGIAYSALSGSPFQLLQQTWMNLPMLLFIVFNLPPYGFTLKHMYDSTEVKATEISSNYGNHTYQSHGRVPMVDFILLQMVMPILLVTFIIYPLPRRAYTSSEYLAIAVEFINAFDIMDMVGDFVFVKHYGIAWEIVYYVSLGTSVALIAFPVKIENEDMVWPATFIVSSQSDFNISYQNGTSSSMTSILDAPIVFESENAIERIHQSNSFQDSHYNESNTQQQTNNTLTNRSSSLPSLCKSSISVRPCLCKNSTSIRSCLCRNGASIRPSDTIASDISGQQQNNINFARTNRVSLELKGSNNLDDQLAVETRKMYRKVVKVVLTLLFTDVMFAALRFQIMMKETSADYGFNMFAKNVILACLHLSYLLQHLKRLIVTKLSRGL